MEIDERLPAEIRDGLGSIDEKIDKLTSLANNLPKSSLTKAQWCEQFWDHSHELTELPDVFADKFDLAAQMKDRMRENDDAQGHLLHSVQQYQNVRAIIVNRSLEEMEGSE